MTMLLYIILIVSNVALWGYVIVNHVWSVHVDSELDMLENSILKGDK